MEPKESFSSSREGFHLDIWDTILMVNGRVVLAGI